MDNSFMAKEPRLYNGAWMVSSINGAGKPEQLYVKNETVPLSYTIHKIQLKMD